MMQCCTNALLVIFENWKGPSHWLVKFICICSGMGGGKFSSASVVDCGHGVATQGSGHVQAFSHTGTSPLFEPKPVIPPHLSSVHIGWGLCVWFCQHRHN